MEIIKSFHIPLCIVQRIISAQIDFLIMWIVEEIMTQLHADVCRWIEPSNQQLLLLLFWCFLFHLDDNGSNLLETLFCHAVHIYYSPFLAKMFSCCFSECHYSWPVVSSDSFLKLEVMTYDSAKRLSVSSGSAACNLYGCQSYSGHINKRLLVQLYCTNYQLLVQLYCTNFQLLVQSYCTNDQLIVQSYCTSPALLAILSLPYSITTQNRFSKL